MKGNIMSLEKVSVVDRVEVLEDGTVQVRTKTAVLENGSQISASFHRHVIVPGQDYSQEDDRVKSICKATHTRSVVDAYKAASAA